jgi:UDP-N-acetylglucosamine 4,6-dehydratase
MVPKGASLGLFCDYSYRMSFQGSSGKTILITGGTGSFGNAFVSYLLKNSNYKRIIIFSRDELKQYEMRMRFKNDERLRWFLGDIRDQSRLERAFGAVDTVIHAAALKQVDTAEYNPIEFVKTNIYGSQNIIEAAINCKVSKVVALSTDKASSPINLYGATKLTADKLFIAAKSYSPLKGTKFSVVRYGNVGGSRGSVIPYFLELRKNRKPLTVTSEEMTRFHIRLEQAVELVKIAHRDMNGGELFVPRIPSYKIMDLVEVIAPNTKIEVIGIRPGEKLHEEMISIDEGRRTFLSGNNFVVLPNEASSRRKLKKVPKGFSYSSNTNPHFLKREDLRKEIELIRMKSEN